MGGEEEQMCVACWYQPIASKRYSFLFFLKGNVVVQCAPRLRTAAYLFLSGTFKSPAHFFLVFISLYPSFFSKYFIWSIPADVYTMCCRWLVPFHLFLFFRSPCLSFVFPINTKVVKGHKTNKNLIWNFIKNRKLGLHVGPVCIQPLYDYDYI